MSESRRRGRERRKRRKWLRQAGGPQEKQEPHTEDMGKDTNFIQKPGAAALPEGLFNPDFSIPLQNDVPWDHAQMIER